MAFFKRAKYYALSFVVFAGEFQHIPDDNELLPVTPLSSGKSRECFNPFHTMSPAKTREPHDKTRESYDKSREPTTVDVFDPVRVGIGCCRDEVVNELGEMLDKIYALRISI